MAVAPADVMKLARQWELRGAADMAEVSLTDFTGMGWSKTKPRGRQERRARVSKGTTSLDTEATYSVEKC